MKNLRNFYNDISGAKKILVLDLGFLGDSIHLIPSLNCIRKAMPDVELHVMIAEHVKEVLELTPWVDRVIGYPRFPKGPKWYQDFDRIKMLRSEKYDAIINLNGSDRSSLLTFATGSPVRLGRVPERKNAIWKYYFTDIVDYPYGKESVFIQRYNCLKNAGFPDCGIEFNLEISAALKASVVDYLPRQSYIHISPFTPVDARELPKKQLAGLLHDISDNHPDDILLLTCSQNEREQGKLKKLIHELHFSKWRIVQQPLSIPQVAAIINGAKIHIGGDTGTLHLAMALGKKTVSWFHENKLNQIHWMPKGEKHRSIVGNISDLGLIGIMNNDIVDAIEALIPEEVKL